MTLWAAEKKEIEKLNELLKGHLPELEKELEQLIRSSDPNVLMLYSRRCLEVIITDLCESELKRPRRTEPLKGIIDKLNKEEKVPSHIITSMHGLNDLSTYGAHPKDFDPEQVKPVLNNLLIVIKWFLIYRDPVTFSNILTRDEKDEAIAVTVKETDIKPVRKRIFSMVFVILIAGIVTLITLLIFDVINLNNLSGKNNTIAVLPFKNLSNDADQEHISYGLVEEILDRLCKLSNLKVISHTSSERFRGSDLLLKEIARQLKVSAVLDGSVQKLGDNIRITVQLIDARTDTHIWSRKFDNDFSDIFSIYSEVAREVARGMNAVLTKEDKRLLEKVPTDDMGAYDAYLNGRLHINMITEKDYETAFQYFTLAIERDPDFALAYAGISRVWTGRQQLGITRVSDAAPRAEAAIRKALALDSTAAFVQRALAGLKTWTKWDWKGGEEAFRKTIRLAPNDADAHAAYSHLLNILGREGEAMRHIETAVELDPFNPRIKSFYGIDLTFVRRFDDAVRAFREALELNPGDRLANGNLHGALYQAGREKEALEALRKYYLKDSEYLKAIDDGSAEAGYQGAMKKLADVNAERSKTSYVNPMEPAVQYAMAGDIDKSIYWLEKAYEEHEPNLPYLLGPRYDKIRDDPRFQELARKMNLPFK